MEDRIENISSTIKVEPTPRTTELILGIIGSIFGLIGAVFAMFIGALDASFNGESSIIGLSIGGFVFSILGLIFSIIVRKNHKIYGALTLLSGVCLLICISLFGSIGAIFFGIAGILGIVRK